MGDIDCDGPFFLGNNIKKLWSECYEEEYINYYHFTIDSRWVPK